MLVEDPQDAALYVARAGIEQDMQHVDLAMIDLEEALKLNPSQTEAYLMRGQIYLSQKKKKIWQSRILRKQCLLGAAGGSQGIATAMQMISGFTSLVYYLYHRNSANGLLNVFLD